tara:strand:- start:27348 stop:28259 length:912 start_codon:yes stop_codon:yes gene_type:complete
MNTLTILIVALSIFGLYININRSDMSNPELMDTSWLSKLGEKQIRENNELATDVKKLIDELKLDPKLIDQGKNINSEEIDDIIKKVGEDYTLVDDTPKKYNEIGEKPGKTDDFEILNLGKNVKGGSSTRAYGWVRPSTVDKTDANGTMSKEDISYKNNYPYKPDELRMKSGDSKILNSYDYLKGKVFKENAQVGTMILPKDTSAFDIKNTFTERATSIYKTRIGPENKILPDVRPVNPDLLKERNNLKLNSLDEMSDSIEIKTRPNLVGFKDTVEHMKRHEKLFPLDKVDSDMKNISRNYNLK